MSRATWNIAAAAVLALVAFGVSQILLSLYESGHPERNDRDPATWAQIEARNNSISRRVSVLAWAIYCLYHLGQWWRLWE